MMRLDKLLLLLTLSLSSQLVRAQFYNMPVTGALSANTCSGVFFDPGGGTANYPTNCNGTYTFCSSSPTSILNFDFVTFNLNNAFDFLRIYAGPSTGAPLIGNYTGTAGPGIVSSAPGGCLTFQFTSGFLLTAPGWKANISCSEPPSVNACPAVSAGADQSVCPGVCVNLTAEPVSGYQTTSYAVEQVPYNPYPFNIGTPILVNVDDIWSSVIALPFNFCFFGQQYNQCVIGSNGVISFDLTYAGTFNQWAIAPGGALPGNNNVRNSILGPYHDIDPSVGGRLYYAIYGSAPCRALVVSWHNIPMFSAPCNSQLATHQIVIYETTNIIETYIQNKPVCSSWNSGRALHGIQNANATQAFTVPGRNNTAITWTASNDGWRFTPNGAPNFTVTWFDGSGNLVGTQETVSVCPNTTTDYIAEVVYTNCDGANLIVTDTVQVSTDAPPPFNVSPSQTDASCGDTNGTASVSVSGGSGSFSYSWDGGVAGNTPTATGLAPGTYTVTVTDNTTPGCPIVQSFTITTTAEANVVITPSGPTSFCSGSSVTLTASGGTTYQWSTPSGAVSGASVVATQSGTYSVTATDANNCTGTASQTVTVFPTPTLVGVNEVCNIEGTQYIITFNIVGGTSPFTVNGATGTLTGTFFTSNPINVGTVVNVSVTDANNCSSQVYTSIGTCNTPQPCNLTGCFGPNLIQDGSFEAYNPANPFASFSSDYLPNNGNGTCTPGGNCNGDFICQSGFAVQPNPLPCNPTWAGVGDHTTGSGNMMIIDFPLGVSRKIWCQTVTLQPATNYCFGAYFINLLPTGTGAPPPIFRLEANNSILGTTPSIPEDEQWHFHGIQFNSGLGGNVQLCIYNHNFGFVGYDLAIDDIDLRELISGVPPTPINDLVSYCAGGSGTINVVANDQPGSGLIDATSVVVTAPSPAVGTVSTDALGNVTFTPAAGFNSPVTLDYQVCDVNGCCSNGTVTFTPSPVPTPIISGPTATCATDAIWSITGGSFVGYFWSTGATTPSITLNQSGTYTVTVTDASSCVGTASATLTVNPLPIATITPSTTTINCTVTTALLQASGGTSYTWSTGATTANITVATGGTYTVTVTDTNGCSASTSVVISQTAVPPTASITGATTINCSSPSTTLTATGGGTYIWSTGATIAAITATVGGTYTVTVTDPSNGCTATASSVVAADFTAPSAAITGNTTINCSNPSSLLTATGGGIYAWSNGSSASATTVTSAGTYTVTVTAANGCTATASVVVVADFTAPVAAISGSTNITCANPSTTLTATGGGTYTWSTGSTTATAVITAAGTYTVTVTAANGCTATAASTVSGNFTAPTATVANSGAITCATASSTLTATGGDTYAWSTGGSAAIIVVTAPGTYTVTVTSASNGCTATASTTVSQDITPPNAQITPGGPLSFCPGGSVSLTALGGGNYTWSTGSAATTITTDATGLYSVTVVNPSNGCTATASVQVTVFIPVIPQATATTPCAGEALTLTATGGVQYQWSGPAGFTSTVSAPVINPAVVGTYSVTSTDANGCTATASVAATVVTVDVDITNGSTVSINEGQSITLNAVSGNPQALFNWSTGQQTPSITVSPTDTTLYVVTASVGDCDATDQIIVVVIRSGTIAVPNAFTPTGSENNIFFPVDLGGGSVTQFRVYNRWGQLLHNSNTPWDGTYDGSLQPKDVYVYDLRILLPNGTTQSIVGDVTLIR